MRKERVMEREKRREREIESKRRDREIEREREESFLCQQRHLEGSVTGSRSSSFPALIDLYTG